MVKTIKNENVHAVSTDIVTRGCCLCIQPYLYKETEAKIKAKHIANTNK